MYECLGNKSVEINGNWIGRVWSPIETEFEIIVPIAEIESDRNEEDFWEYLHQHGVG